METGIAGKFDLSRTQERQWLTNNEGGSFREKFGQSLFTDEEKRTQEYAEGRYAALVASIERKMEQMRNQIDMGDSELVAATGRGHNRNARTVDEQFQPAEHSVEMRLMGGPIRV